MSAALKGSQSLFAAEDAEWAFRRAFVELVERVGSPHAAKRPTEGFRSVLLALATAPPRGWFGQEIVARSTVTQSNLIPILRRMRAYGLLVSTREAGSMKQLGRKQRTYHLLTVDGARLAELARHAGPLAA